MIVLAWNFDLICMGLVTAQKLQKFSNAKIRTFVKWMKCAKHIFDESILTLAEY